MFAATHRVLLGLVAEGLIDGLRIDHPDGLADPRGYLRRLATATGGAWVVTEKILAATSSCPPTGPCAGTTGYDSLAAVGGLFTDPAGAAPLTERVRRPHRRAAQEFAPVAGGRQARGGGRPVRRRGLAAWPGCWPGAGHPDAGRRCRPPTCARCSPNCSRASASTARTWSRASRPPPAAAAVVARGRRGRPGSGCPRAPARRRSPPSRDLVLGRGCGPGRARDRADHGVPADLRPGDGQGRGGHRVLPLDAADRAERGRRRPGPARASAPAEFHAFAARLRPATGPPP